MKFELDLRFVCPLSSHCPDEHLRLHVGLIDYSIRCIFLRVQRMYSPFHCVGMRCPQLCDRGITHWHLDHPQQLVPSLRIPGPKTANQPLQPFFKIPGVAQMYCRKKTSNGF